jgi:diguanylate cyclase (GGDEF)-like protein
MLNAVDNILSSLPRHWIALLALLLIGLVGAIDYLAGYELSLFIFYLIPVGLASWYLNRPFGLLISVIAASTCLLADFFSGHTYSNMFILYWTASVRFSFFIIISYLLGNIHVILDLQSSLARKDGLTGLNNARAFKLMCAPIMEISKRNKHSMALGYIDLDGFKGINDRMGHSVGDQVLREIGNAIGLSLRTSDIGARMGGDEFCVLLPETDSPGAQIYFNRLKQSLDDLATRNQWPVSFSMGIAVLDSFEGDIDEAIHYADELMYQIKHSGKNNIALNEYRSVSNRA